MNLLAPLHYLTYLLTPQRHQRIREAHQRLSEDSTRLRDDISGCSSQFGSDAKDRNTKAASSDG